MCALCSTETTHEIMSFNASIRSVMKRYNATCRTSQSGSLLLGTNLLRLIISECFAAIEKLLRLLCVSSSSCSIDHSLGYV